jgi:coenzyme PQQ precursor peptide PqqA
LSPSGVAPQPARDYSFSLNKNRRKSMAWTTPTLVEICIGLEINGYLPAEF